MKIRKQIMTRSRDTAPESGSSSPLLRGGGGGAGGGEQYNAVSLVLFFLWFLLMFLTLCLRVYLLKLHSPVVQWSQRGRCCENFLECQVLSYQLLHKTTNAFEKKSSCTQTRANADSSGTKAIKTSGQEGPNTKVSLHQIKVTPPVLPSNDHCIPGLQTRWLPHRLWVRQWIKKEPAPGHNCERTLVTMRNKLYIDTDSRSRPCPPDETNLSLQAPFNASLDAKREERK